MKGFILLSTLLWTTFANAGPCDSVRDGLYLEVQKQIVEQMQEELWQRISGLYEEAEIPLERKDVNLQMDITTTANDFRVDIPVIQIFAGERLREFSIVNEDNQPESPMGNLTFEETETWNSLGDVTGWECSLSAEQAYQSLHLQNHRTQKELARVQMMSDIHVRKEVPSPSLMRK